MTNLLRPELTSYFESSYTFIMHYFSKKFKRAWLQCNQRTHDMLLARPRSRYLQRWPDPALEISLPAPVPVAALRARASVRTKQLARPRHIVAQPSPRQPGVVEPSCLQFKPTQRLMELARPALKSRAASPSSKKSLKKKKKLYSKERVEYLAQRHVVAPPTEVKKKEGKPLSKLLPRILLLCELPQRYQSPDLPSVPVGVKLQLDKKTFEASNHTKHLAKPREYPEFRLDEEFDPYIINPAALTYKPTDNIKKLAEPKRKEEKRIKK